MTRTADELISLAQDLLERRPLDVEFPLEDWGPLKRSELARNIASVASALQFQEQLVLSHQARKIQAEQLELQRTVGFPGLAGAVELVERIAETEDGRWDAGMVNDWIAQARKLDTP